ncbi:MAG: site-specific DNA-methyltransferase [Synergistaceae bacterium]|nr:site-specific DNA-methyltransferase [Synergistaceae bacterium]MBR0317591.1 site-specific DNA-methyltransferase [Synergistaceae bacterium]
MYDTIINGNSIFEMSKLEAESIDLIFADPPYYMRTEGVLNRVEGTKFNGCNDDWDKFDSLEDYENFTSQWLSQCKRILKSNGSIWVIGSMQCIYTIGALMQKLGFWFINDVVWHKTNPTPNFMGSRLNNSHETLIWAVKNKNSKFTFHYKTAKELNSENDVKKQMGSVWNFPVCSGNERLKDSDGNKLHNTQKPLKMLERIIAISSNIGDLVLDPFAGTMTTGAAAKKLGRKFIMIEADKKYCEYGKLRLDSIQFEDSNIARAEFDKKPLRVTMPEMISAGFFKVGEWFLFKDGRKIAQLSADGKLSFNGKIIDMHTCAASAKGLKAKRINGFDVWYVIRDNQLVSISSIRENFREKLNLS